MRRPVLALLLALALVAPAAAHAQTGANPFAPQAETSGPVADADRDTDGGGLPGWAEGLIIVAGVVLILGIGVAIVRDARSAAGEKRERVPDRRGGPAGDEALASGLPGASASRRRANARDRKRKKIARESRRRNR